jgi:hypothetical protein
MVGPDHRAACHLNDLDSEAQPSAGVGSRA